MYSNSPHVTWSLVTPHPIVVYVPSHDEHVVYWNGIVLTHAHALQLTLVPYGIYAPPKVKAAITKRFKELYSSGVFGNVPWDKFVHNNGYYQYISKKLEKHIATVTQGVDVYDAVKWLDVEMSRKG